MSSIPRFTNPYNIVNHGRGTQLQLVSRANLFHDDNELSLHDPEEHDEKDLYVKALEDRVRTSLDVDALAMMFQNHGKEGGVNSKKRKRRRDGETEEGELEVKVKEETQFQFRLLSIGPQPALISVQPKFLERVSIERTCEDSAHAATVRASRAREAAVEPSWLEEQSKLTYPPVPGPSKLRALHVLPTTSAASLEPSLSVSTLLLLEGPREVIQKSLPTKKLEPGAAIPCREPNVRCCKTVAVNDRAHQREEKQRRRPRCPRRGRQRGLRAVA